MFPGGGGNAVIVGNQIIGGGSTPISSTNTERVHDRFFLVDEAAQQETDISLTNWNFPARVGNNVAFCWLIPQGQKRGPFVCGINYTLNHEQFAKAKLPRFNLLYHAPFKFFRFCFAVLVGIIGSYLSSLFTCLSYESFDFCRTYFAEEFEFSFSFATALMFAISAVAGWLIFTGVAQIVLAKAINKGIAAEQEMRDAIRQLCREAQAKQSI